VSSARCPFTIKASSDIKKGPGIAGAFFEPDKSLKLDSRDVGRLEPFGTLHHVERNLIAFSQGLETFTRDGGEMHEDVLAILLLKKTKPLAVVEPLYRTVYHLFFLFLLLLFFIYPRQHPGHFVTVTGIGKESQGFYLRHMPPPAPSSGIHEKARVRGPSRSTLFATG
jgi:hypothetical protein